MKTGEALREKIRARLAEMPFRGAPNFDDVVEAIAAAADHLGGGSDDTSTEALKAKVQSLETRLVALQSTVDGLTADLTEHAKGTAAAVQKGVKEAVASIATDFDALEARVKAAEDLATAPASKAASTDKAAPDKKAAKD